MIQIITDSTSDLGDELCQKHALPVVPLQIIHQNQTFRDGLDLTPQDLFQRIDESGELPKTSAASIIDFTQVFQQAPQSIYIGISSQLSCSYQNAELAAESLPERQIRVIDSLNLSSGIGLLVLRAADLRDQGCSLDEIDAAVRDMIPKIRTAFVLDTLEYLYKGGRCSALQNIAGSILKIRPVIQVRTDGTLGVKEKIRGNRAKTLQALLDGIFADEDILDRSRIFITHAGSPADATYLAEEIENRLHPQAIHITEAGSVIASHCGPGTIGILYAVK